MVHHYSVGVEGPGADQVELGYGAPSLEGAAVKLKDKGIHMASPEDVNGDGMPDLVVHVVTDSLDLTSGDSEAHLSGFTYRAVPMFGKDSVRVLE